VAIDGRWRKAEKAHQNRHFLRSRRGARCTEGQPGAENVDSAVQAGPWRRAKSITHDL
jgi:hypothetical protein